MSFTFLGVLAEIILATEGYRSGKFFVQVEKIYNVGITTIAMLKRGLVRVSLLKSLSWP